MRTSGAEVPCISPAAPGCGLAEPKLPALVFVPCRFLFSGNLMQHFHVPTLHSQFYMIPLCPFWLNMACPTRGMIGHRVLPVIPDSKDPRIGLKRWLQSFLWDADTSSTHWSEMTCFQAHSSPCPVPWLARTRTSMSIMSICRLLRLN